MAFTLIQAKGQVSKLISKNANGSEEYLYHHRKANFYEYATNTRPKRIRLINVKKIMVDGQKVQVVKFPGNKALYQLAATRFQLICTNPDGSRQTFLEETKYVCKGKYVTEYLYMEGYSSAFYYDTNRSMSKVKLKILGGYQHNPILKFPGGKDNYAQVMFMDNGNIECKRPDGSRQTFIKVK